MKKITSWLFLAAFAAFGPGCQRGAQSPGPSAAASAEQAIEAAAAVDAQFVAAFNAGDIDGLMATYWNGPDVVLYPPDALEARGWEAIKAGWTAFLSGAGGARLELLEPQRRAAGDFVIGWGTWRLTMPSAGSAPTEMMGRYSDIKTQRDGKWVMIVDHASVPLPPPAEELETEAPEETPAQE